MGECIRCEFREKCKMWGDVQAALKRGRSVGMFGDALYYTVGKDVAEVCEFYRELPKEQV